MGFEGLKKIQENRLSSTEKFIHIANAKWHITFNAMLTKIPKT